MSIDTQADPTTIDESHLEPAGSEQPEADFDAPVMVIQPQTGWFPVDLAELWRHRELLFFFAWRDIKVRYKQTELGVLWVLIQPLLSTGIFAVLFRLLLGAGNEPSAGNVPYFLSTFCAMLPWQLFAESLTRAGGSVVQNRDMVQKIYFPRLVLPLAATFGCLVDFAIALVALVGLMILYGATPTWAILTLPLFVGLAVVASLSVSLWLSALSAMYRDFLYVQPFLIRIGMFVSPVIYSVGSLEHKLPDWALVLYGLNPMAGVIEGFRWAVLGTGGLSPLIVIPSTLVTGLAFLTGAMYFGRMEQKVVDVV
jgi:lipopolysaccharide transport system permease protein